MLIALSGVGCSTAIAGAAANARVETIMIRFALITALANHILMALAFANKGIAF